MRKTIEVTQVEVLESDDPLDFVTFTRICSLKADTVAYLVDAGVLEPLGRSRADWRFPARAVSRGRTAARLMHDLQVDEASVGLVLDLIEERDELRRQLSLLNSLLEGK
jgi:chaperone modulatory protein CbpM